MGRQDAHGKALKRSKQKRVAAVKAVYQAILDLEHREHVEQETAPKLRSIWQTSNMQDVLEAANERELGFTAERDVRVVVGGAVHVIVGDKISPQSDERDWVGLSEGLDIPHRPTWDFKTKAEQLANDEKKMFVEWRRQLGEAEDNTKIILTPYEKNLEVWRQLWRVVERSDIIMQIVDARNPLIFRSHGFERYCAKHLGKGGAAKSTILLLNKADLLSEEQRQVWAVALKDMGVKFFFFSARPLEENEDSDSSDDASEAGSIADREAVERGDYNPDDDDDDCCTATIAPSVAPGQRRRLERRLRGAPVRNANPYEVLSSKEEMLKKQKEQKIIRETVKPATEEEIARNARVKEIAATFQPYDILSPESLLDQLALLRETVGVQINQPATVGMVGYPNVGKSSTINAIMDCHKVIVSATPGKTKHFQTLTIPNERRIILCDCPGLVFPSFSSTREAMVCDGVLPVDTVKDYYTPIELVCRRVPKMVLEKRYNIDVTYVDEDQDLSATLGERLLNVLSRRKGFMTEHDKPNRYRSAKIILKDYVDGRIVYAHPPPRTTINQPEGMTLSNPAVAAADGEGEWESDSEGADVEAEWEDVSDAEDERGLSDAGSDGGDEHLGDKVVFYQRSALATAYKLTDAEAFNVASNLEYLSRPDKKRFFKKAHTNHQLNEDYVQTVRYNHKGEKELLIDEDDDIVMMRDTQQEAAPKAASKTKKAQRRDAKRTGMGLKQSKLGIPS
jgi:large subunit GTPase 1